MKEIYLLRHGDTEATEKGFFAGWSDIPLSPKGEERIKKLHQSLLRGLSFERVFCSPMLRTLQTARILVPDDDIDIVPEIKERSFGSWEGKSWAELEKEYPVEVKEWKKDPLGFTPPGGESFEAVLSRVSSFWDKLLKMRNGRYLLVTHAGVIRCFLVKAMNIEFASTFHVLLDPGVLVKIGVNREEFPRVELIQNNGV